MKVVVLDVGGTNIKSGLIENGKLTDKKITPADALPGGLYLMEIAQKIISEYKGFDGIGFSTAGQVNSERGIIRYANQNIPNYTGMRVREILEDAFNVPVAVENDVNAAALGEAVYGVGKTMQEKNFLCLTYGTGVGGAIIIDGKLFKGASFSAGEFGHIITHGKKHGYYENYASAAALITSAREVKPELKNGKEVLAHLDNPAVKDIVDNWIDEILYGLSSLIHIFNPSHIVLGGGIMVEDNYIVRSIKERIKDFIMPSFGNVVLVQAALGNDAGLYGAGYLASMKLITQ